MDAAEEVGIEEAEVVAGTVADTEVDEEATAEGVGEEDTIRITS